MCNSSYMRLSTSKHVPSCTLGLWLSNCGHSPERQMLMWVHHPLNPVRSLPPRDEVLCTSRRASNAPHPFTVLSTCRCGSVLHAVHARLPEQERCTCGKKGSPCELHQTRFELSKVASLDGICQAFEARTPPTKTPTASKLQDSVLSSEPSLDNPLHNLRSCKQSRIYRCRAILRALLMDQVWRTVKTHARLAWQFCAATGCKSGSERTAAVLEPDRLPAVCRSR